LAAAKTAPSATGVLELFEVVGVLLPLEVMGVEVEAFCPPPHPAKVRQATKKDEIRKRRFFISAPLGMSAKEYIPFFHFRLQAREMNQIVCPSSSPFQ
jgi:hypothetical protein